MKPATLAIILVLFSSLGGAQTLKGAAATCPLVVGAITSGDSADGTASLVDAEVYVLLEKLERREALDKTQLEILIPQIQNAFDPYTHELTFDVIGTATDIQMKLERRVPLELYEVQYLREGFAGKF